MNSSWIGSVWTAIAVVLPALVGCRPATFDGYSYVLEARRAQEPSPIHSRVALEVRRFGTDAAFAEKPLVYRTGPLDYEVDFYNVFLVSPAVMVTDKTRNWLADSGLVAQVLVPGSRIEPTHTLEGHITEMYGDLRDPTAPAAVLTLRFFVMADDTMPETVVYGGTYTASVSLGSETAEGVMRALDQCLVDVLGRLEVDLRQVFSTVDR